MTYFGVPLAGPEGPGGLFPRSESYNFRNRAGATLARGAVGVLDLTGSAAEVDISHAGAGRPGYGDATDDGIWNTMVDPVAATHIGTNALGATRPAIFGVVRPAAGVVDNATAKFQIYGVVENARILSTGGTNLVPGMPLTVTITNSFNATIVSNNRVVAFYCGVTNAVTNAAELGRVMLHNGAGYHWSASESTIQA